MDPNFGFKDPSGVITTVLKKKHFDIDYSPEQSNASDEHLDGLGDKTDRSVTRGQEDEKVDLYVDDGDQPGKKRKKQPKKEEGKVEEDDAQKMQKADTFINNALEDLGYNVEEF